MEREDRVERNPWKIATLTIAALLGAALVSGAVIAGVRDGDARDAQVSPHESTAAVATPEPPRESCDRYLPAMRRDRGHIAKDGLVGGAIGAGLGAASGAIISGGKGAGRGAGVGALVGVAAGSYHGYDQETQKAEQARAAYQRCMAAQG